MDTCGDDLATLIETLALKDAVVIGFSAGGGEVARYIEHHGADLTERLTSDVDRE